MSRSRRFEIALAACWVALAGGSALGQLYSNASGVPGTPALAGLSTSSAGLAAPFLGAWCEPASIFGSGANGLLGVSAHPSVEGNHRVADDFMVSSPTGWIIDGVQLFAYVPDWVGAGSPFASANLRVWNGPPGEPGSLVIWDGGATNRLTASNPLNLWRIVEQSTNPVAAGPDQRRRIWKLELTINRLILPAGEYWLDWQIAPSTPAVAVFCPPATIQGVRTGAAFNARQFGLNNGVAAWTAIIDTGKPLGVADFPQDMPFVLLGSVVPPPCLGDFDGDLFLTQEDLSGFITAFLSEPPVLGPGGFAKPCPGEPAPYNAGFQIDINRDCAADQEDLSLFITAFFDGCL